MQSLTSHKGDSLCINCAYLNREVLYMIQSMEQTETKCTKLNYAIIHHETSVKPVDLFPFGIQDCKHFNNK